MGTGALSCPPDAFTPLLSLISNFQGKQRLLASFLFQAPVRACASKHVLMLFSQFEMPPPSCDFRQECGPGLVSYHHQRLVPLYFSILILLMPFLGYDLPVSRACGLSSLCASRDARFKDTLTRHADELEAYYVLEPDETGNGHACVLWKEEAHPCEIALVFRVFDGHAIEVRFFFSGESNVSLSGRPLFCPKMSIGISCPLVCCQS